MDKRFWKEISKFLKGLLETNVEYAQKQIDTLAVTAKEVVSLINTDKIMLLIRTEATLA